MRYKRNFNLLKIVECDNAICVAVNNNDKRYYAKGIKSKQLNIKKILYEQI